MPQSFAFFDAALKDTYGPGLRNALNNSHPILTELNFNRDDVVGRQAVWAVHSGRSTSTGNRRELAALPTADRQRFIQPRDDLAYMYHTIKVSGQAKHLSRNDTGAFARALETELKGAEKDVKNDLARQMFNKAVTINSALALGALAQVQGAPAANVITIDYFSEAQTPSNITRPFFVGETIDAVTPATGAISGSAMVVSAITAGTPSITVVDDGSTADNDYLFRSGNYNAGDSEINGLPFLLGSQNYAGITAASNPVWNGLTAGSASTGISETLLEEAQEKVETDGDGSTPNLFIAEHVQRRKLASMLQAQKRYDGRDMTLKAGWKGLQVAQGALLVDRFCPSHQIYGITTSEMEWFVGLDWQWDDDDGKVLYKALDGSDAVEARYKSYFNLEALTRNAHVVVTVAEPTF
jgi:hypothetical protein